MNMIERVAYALAVANERKASVQELAKIAIAAMRDPTEEMKVVEGVHWGYSCAVCGGAQEHWELMIDAALKE